MVLLITHDKPLGRQVTQLIKATGHPTSLSCTGREAIRWVRETVPTLVVLDLYLEKPSGIEILRQLRGQIYRGKIILLAGISVRPMIPEAQRLGVVQVLGRPLTPEPLESAIRSTLVTEWSGHAYVSIDENGQSA